MRLLRFEITFLRIVEQARLNFVVSWHHCFLVKGPWIPRIYLFEIFLVRSTTDIFLWRSCLVWISVGIVSYRTFTRYIYKHGDFVTCFPEIICFAFLSIVYIFEGSFERSYHRRFKYLHSSCHSFNLTTEKNLFHNLDLGHDV